MTQGLVEVRDLALGYHGETVLKLDELTVAAGEFVSVLGPSGCGKTTLLNALAGFVTPDAGRILVDGQDVTHVAPQHRQMGLVFQNYALFPHLNVEKNLHYGLKARKVPRDERETRVRDALKLVGLEDFRARFPGQLSGGQQQRVAIARALVTRPKVLLLDEPLSNLDAKLRRQMRHELRELQREIGTTTIFVTHDQAEALAMSDRVVLLAGGGLEQHGTPQELYRTPRTTFTADFIGAANIVKATIGTDGRADVLKRSVAVPEGQGLEAGTSEVALRPEAVTVTAAETPGTVAAEVMSVAFGGDRYEYRVRVDAETTLLASASGREDAYAPGATVGLAFEDASVIWLGGSS
ncbi:ABC transporter ATP-binding protein [Kineosporia babensis]|uniref:ABC-type quaternary amine transporter n=1 Tax=Kineosporia babensis TaxID=499548 RepID=A0A9X1NDN6_9ACTN|nr:ABC transporter ATP-binding protein [Kineosporia babensis]MCD5311836.1 ABC transporter ATP-binding protein [Kineosporia babensis]